MTSPTAPPRCSYEYPQWLGDHEPCAEGCDPEDPDGRCFCHSERADKPAVEMARRVKAKVNRGDKDFDAYVFPPFTNLSGLAFGAGVSYCCAVFGEEIIFHESTFDDGADFSGSRFGHGADFGYAVFGARANFRGAEFGDRAYFGNTAFEDGATFGNEADFSGASFGAGALFGGTRFGAGTRFEYTTFGARTRFDEAEFDGSVSFSEAAFGEEMSFFGVVLHGVITFYSATFENDTIFEHTMFHAGASFEAARLGGVAFRHCTLPLVSFRYAVGMDVAVFEEVTWGQRGGRPIVGDDDWARAWSRLWGYGPAERVYREIRRSYLRRRDFTLARQMHYGEMEMRRLGQRARLREAKGWRNQLSAFAEWALISAYRPISGYGTRWQRAALSILLLLLVSALGYAAELVSQGYGLDIAANWGLFQALLSAILRPYYAPMTFLGRLLNFVQMVASPIIITTLVLAVREQFRR